MQPQILLSAIASYAVITSLVAALMFITSTEAYPADDRLAPQPPWYFDYPYQGNLEVTYKPSPDLVHVACTSGPLGVKDTPLGFKVRACAFSYNEGKNCDIILPAKRFYTNEAWQSIVRHELGHCNGWNGKHNN